MPDLKAPKPNEDDDDVKRLIIEHDYKKLLARNCCWAGIHTACIGLLLFGYFAYPLCPYNQATAVGFIFFGVMSFLTFWAYILIILCDTLLFVDGITVFPDVFIHKLNQANSVWFMINCTMWCLMLVGLIVITAMAAPLFQKVNDDDSEIFKIIACTAFEKCCDKTIYLVGHILILLLWAIYLAILICILAFYIVPACKRCCNKKKAADDSSEPSEGESGSGDSEKPSRTPPPKNPPSKNPPTKTPPNEDTEKPPEEPRGEPPEEPSDAPSEEPPSKSAPGKGSEPSTGGGQTPSRPGVKGGGREDEGEPGTKGGTKAGGSAPRNADETEEDFEDESTARE